MNRNNTDTISVPLPIIEIVLVIALSLSPYCNACASEPSERNPELPGTAAQGSPLMTSADPERASNIEMVFVKGGCFEMGDSFRQGGDDERPVHEVCLDDFYIGKFEITQEQWQAVMGSNPATFKDCGGACPIENVSWDDVKGFIEKLNDKTGKRYRLPTEAEWEYAARSGGMGAKWSGTNDVNELAEYAWYADNAAKKTHPVGQKKPNSLGIYDMSGNISEWILDRYHANYYRQSPKENPRGPESGGYRVLRGGNYYDTARHLRTSYRDQYSQSYRISCVGLRLMMMQ